MSSGGGELFVLVLVGVCIGIYFLPVIIASRRNHPNTGAIALINIFLGWTMLGWIGALVWAILNTEKQVVVVQSPPAPVPPPRPAAPVAIEPTLAPATKNCPFCAEPVLLAAIKCKHCGSSI